MKHPLRLFSPLLLGSPDDSMSAVIVTSSVEVHCVRGRDYSVPLTDGSFEAQRQDDRCKDLAREKNKRTELQRARLNDGEYYERQRDGGADNQIEWRSESPGFHRYGRLEGRWLPRRCVHAFLPASPSLPDCLAHICIRS
ncbi:unnamed protein product [Pleuronectes platessa]|uniref:Uncharacterized protein n=1 Tax=Pleuronectes platessa TaxID=8262 RepID=A0A9N7YIF1_PLEPL|nr:unnamed protein product [Pleuronectes platessa]